MFFKKHSEHRKKKGFGIIRLFISIIMLSILGLGLFLAYKQFSGVDPLSVNPKSLIKNFATSESAYAFVTALFSASPPKSLDDVKKLLSNNPAVTTTAGGGGQTEQKHNGPIKFKFAVIADSHKDIDNLRKALNQAKGEDAKFIIGMGDFSDVGTKDELQSTKDQFDILGLPFYITAGDHDLWDSRDKKLPAEQNFIDIFGTPYQAFSFENARFILIYDSDNYLGLDSNQIKWVEDEVARVQSEKPKPAFVFASTPFFHPSSDHVMGKTTPKLKNQADHLISIIGKSGVDQTFFADTHFASNFVEPTSGLKMTTVGAVTSVRNPQTPRFVMVDVHEDGSYNIREVEVK